MVKVFWWQLRQKVPAGMLEPSWIEALHAVLGPLRMKLAVEPWGPFGSAALFDS